MTIMQNIFLCNKRGSSRSKCQSQISNNSYSSLETLSILAVNQITLIQTIKHYCSYDRLHQDNTKVEVECLRRLEIVPVCFGVNSQVVEELFSWLNKSQHFLSQMSPLHHIFLIWLLLDLNNGNINASMEKHFKIIFLRNFQDVVSHRHQIRGC